MDASIFAFAPSRFFPLVTALLCSLLLGACAGLSDVAGGGKASQIIISVRDQKMTVLREGGGRVSFPISTSKFGLGDRRRSYATPTGTLEVAQKIGGGAPAGAVFHGRIRTGEIVKVNAPGRDPIVTRILALRGLEDGNRDAESRGIYIHGTPEERLIGQPASYGCIRMRSRDVIQLYDMVGLHTKVRILDESQGSAVAAYSPRPVAPPPVTAPEAAGEPPSATLASVDENASAARRAGMMGSDRTRHEWAGSPEQLLSEKTPAPSVRMVRTSIHSTTGAHPVSNSENDSSSGNSGRGSSGSRNLSRPMQDSL